MGESALHPPSSRWYGGVNTVWYFHSGARPVRNTAGSAFTEMAGREAHHLNTRHCGPQSAVEYGPKRVIRLQGVDTHVMRRSAKNYYVELRNGYTIKIRQLVPKHDDMIGCIIDLLKLCSPAKVLDIGAEVGSLSLLVLRELPIAQLTAVEISEEMMSEAREALQTSVSRVLLVHKNILDFSPEGTFDAIFTNLVLHNIAFERKLELIFIK